MAAMAERKKPLRSYVHPYEVKEEKKSKEVGKKDGKKERKGKRNEKLSDWEIVRDFSFSHSQSFSIAS